MVIGAPQYHLSVFINLPAHVNPARPLYLREAFHSEQITELEPLSKGGPTELKLYRVDQRQTLS